MNDKTLCLRLIRRGVLCLLVLFMFQSALTPRPAEAYTCSYEVDWQKSVGEWLGAIWDWIKNLIKSGEMQYYTEQVKTTYSKMKETYADFIEQDGVRSRLRDFSDKLAAELGVREQIYLMSVETESQSIQEKIRFVGRHTSSKSPMLCKGIIAARGVAQSLPSMEETARSIFESLQARARCATCGGLDYMLDFTTQTNKMGYGDPIDGFVPDTKLSEIRGSDGSGLAGANLAPPRESLVLELPKMIEEPISDKKMVLRPDTTNLTPNQRFFLAQWDRLFSLLMDRPAPKNGDLMNTAMGLAERQTFDHCGVMESTFIKPCVDLVAFFARPSSDETDERAKAKRAQQQSLCKVVENIIDLERFDNCEKGLSPYEEQLITHEFCKSLAYAQEGPANGAKSADQTEGSDQCLSTWLSWRVLVETQKDMCTKGVVKLRSSRECWNELATIQGNGPMYSSSKAAPTGAMKHNVSLQEPTLSEGSP